MKCLRCVEEGKTSKVYSEGGTSTLMTTSVFWDEEGNKHCHNPNINVSGYRCSNGHRFSIKSRAQCPEKSCPIHQQEVEVTFHDA